MGEIEGTYRVLQTPGTRLGARTPVGVSTLESGQTLSAVTGTPARMREKHHVRVELLDNSVEVFDVEPRCDGQTLLTQVWERLNLLEHDYFGLELQNAPSCWIWLEPLKPIVRQVRRPRSAALRLAVKFFPPDPGQLQEEHTRYLFALQLKRDLLEGRLSCTDTTAALLASHLLQSEIGDYDESLDREHLGAHEYVPHQERCLEKILEFHRTHTGQTPAESDFQVLEVARKLELYGIRFHQASDREGAPIRLAVSHMGVLVYQSTTRINTFNWSRVRKLSFKRKRFLVKLHPEVHGPYQDTLEFLLGSRDECKNFWKICVEYHTFFRLFDQPKPKAKAVFFSRGSSFRYSGRTQKQLADCVRDGGKTRIPYERRHSRTRASVRALTADLPKQSISLPEGVRTPSAPPPADAAFFSVPASPRTPPGRPDLKDSSGSLTEPPAPRVRRPAAERSSGAPDAPRGPPPGHPAPRPRAGAGLGRVARSCGPGGPVSGGGAGGGREHGAAGGDGGGGGGLPVGSPPSEGRPPRGRPGGVGAPVFTLTNAQLQVSEEFIDDDPADISFFAGGSEAFSLPYRGRPGSAPPGAAPAPRGFEFEDESGFGGDALPSDTSELWEVKAQASLLHSLLSPSESSSLRTNQSGASSMANFPACSVRSEASSALQLSDLTDQLEPLGCPPSTAEDWGSSGSDSWGSEAEGRLDLSLFLGRPCAQAGAARVLLDSQNHVKALSPGERTEKSPP